MPGIVPVSADPAVRGPPEVGQRGERCSARLSGDAEVPFTAYRGGDMRPVHSHPGFGGTARLAESGRGPGSAVPIAASATSPTGRCDTNCPDSPVTSRDGAAGAQDRPPSGRPRPWPVPPTPGGWVAPSAGQPLADPRPGTCHPVKTPRRSTGVMIGGARCPLLACRHGHTPRLSRRGPTAPPPVGSTTISVL